MRFIALILCKPESVLGLKRLPGRFFDFNQLFAFAGLGYFVGGLHAHQGFHLDAEGFFDTKGHVTGEAA